MAYPKPLSEKTIRKLYAESELTEEKIEFLRNFFEGSAFLYGVVSLSDLWEIYKEFSRKTETVKILKKDILTFSSIARREEHDYYVYEIDELYSAEKRADKDRFLIIKEVIEDCRLDVFYKLYEMQLNHPYYIPDDLLEIKGPLISEQEEKLRIYVENLKADAPILHNRWNEKKTRISPHQGKKLKDFSFLNDEDLFEIDWLSGKRENGPKKPQTKKLNEFMESIKGTCSERLFRGLRFNIFTGWLSFTDVIKYFMKDLAEVGVELSMDEANHLISMISDFSNNSRIYINRGWTPSELAVIERKENPGFQTISFGPGIMQAVKEGKISLEELKKQAESMGFRVQI